MRSSDERGLGVVPLRNENRSFVRSEQAGPCHTGCQRTAGPRLYRHWPRRVAFRVLSRRGHHCLAAFGHRAGGTADVRPATRSRCRHRRLRRELIEFRQPDRGTWRECGQHPRRDCRRCGADPVLSLRHPTGQAARHGGIAPGRRRCFAIDCGNAWPPHVASRWRDRFCAVRPRLVFMVARGCAWRHRVHAADPCLVQACARNFAAGLAGNGINPRPGAYDISWSSSTCSACPSTPSALPMSCCLARYGWPSAIHCAIRPRQISCCASSRSPRLQPASAPSRASIRPAISCCCTCTC